MAQLTLNKSQAEMVYSAICHLNNVSGELAASLPDRIKVYASDDGTVTVTHGLATCETYRFQADFAAAYGLDGGA